MSHGWSNRIIIGGIFGVAAIAAISLMLGSRPMQANTLPAGSTTLVINEIDYDQAGTDDAEYMEIKNVSGAPINLAAYELRLINGFNNALYDTIFLPAVDLPAGDYFVICANSGTVSECDLDVSPETNLIQNGAPDAVALLTGGQIVDTVSYEGSTSAPYTEGSGIGLEDDPDVLYASIARFPDGTDSDRNNLDFSLRCSTPGEANALARRYCLGFPTPTYTPTPPSTNTPPAGATSTPTRYATPRPPTAEVTFTPSVTPSPSLTPTPTATPYPPTPTPALVHIPVIENPFFSHEPNDNAAQANGPIASGEIVFGSFPLGDHRSDYYYFDMDWPYTIQATLTHIPAGHDYDLVIRDAAMNVIGYSGEYDNQDEAALTVMVFPGRYFIQIFNWSNTYTFERYYLQVTYIYTP